MSEAIVSGCSGKKRFLRFGLAQRAALRRNRHDGGAHLEVYHCRYCQGFHVGESRSHGLRAARKAKR